MPESFLILLAGGIMLAAAVPNPKDVTLQWLRLAGIIALTMAGLAIAFAVFRNNAQGARDWAYWIPVVATSVLVLAQLATVQLAKRQSQRAFAIVASVTSVLAAMKFGQPWGETTSGRGGLDAMLAMYGIAALPGIALMDMLLGHAYLTASRMTMTPFRQLNLSLGIAIVLRAILAIGVTMFLNARHPVYMLWNVYGLYIITRWIVGLLIPGIFAWMAHDCIKRRSTQSATGILYVAGVLIFIGEIIALYLLRQTGLPF